LEQEREKFKEEAKEKIQKNGGEVNVE